MAHNGKRYAKEDVDGGIKNRFEEVQLVVGFGSRYIGTKKHNSCSPPQHNQDKAMMLMNAQ